MHFRKLKESDWDTLQSWWSTWPEWTTPSKDFLPGDGTSGFMVEKDGQPIVACFVYLTNSKAVLLEWIISNPNYRESDRGLAIEKLIVDTQDIVKKLGMKYMFTITRHKHLLKLHEKLGWTKDETPSHELTKIL
tara:strand:- start:16837 stop:17238 length:402 start_codon:yes stop_codon:yes gene_type:complete